MTETPIFDALKSLRQFDPLADVIREEIRAWYGSPILIRTFGDYR